MMARIFSYGTLQLADVQLSTFGRRLDGERDRLLGYELTFIDIHDATVMKRLKKTQHNNLRPTGNDDDAVEGTALTVTDAELMRADAYEAQDHYKRILVRLSSGSDAWVYIHDDQDAHSA